VVTIETTLSVGEALARLAEFRLLSAPLVIRLDTSPDHYTILAWLGIGDLLRRFLEMSAAQLDALPGDATREVELARLGVSFATSPVVSVHTAADEESTLMYWDGVKDLSVASLCRRMLRLPLVRPPRTMRGRVGFFDTHGKLESLISTSDVLSFAAVRLPPTSAPASLTLSELGLVSGAPRTVPATMATYLALREVAVCRAVGVVDSSGRLVAVFSVSELRGMREADFGSLALPVGRWLHAKLGVPEPTIAGADDPWAAALLAARAVVALPPDAPLSAALAAVDSHKVRAAALSYTRCSRAISSASNNRCTRSS
jgi:CBS domain-containing protein